MANKREDRHLRIIYTRLLERSLTKFVSYLSKDENSDKERFVDFIKQIEKPLLTVSKVPLDSEYYNMLEKLVFYIIDHKSKEFDLDKAKIDILRSANRLKKLRRIKNNHKIKHKHKKFDDGN